MSKPPTYLQYQVVVVNLEPTLGSETRKVRPCVIISPNEMNEHLRTVIVAPLTSRNKGYPTRVPVNVNKQRGYVMLEQIRTIDKRRISKTGDRLRRTEINDLRRVIKEMLYD
ncbi:type II toxin-antitoxin system PemK/MazF family toxin [Lewinella cohaerens]|uniref:type II toxin-antitoxin system PemK/MazF family toxin n=1 Tax=Lewinella cohaerens TaxID=70995 RepID=UPI000361D346|nr:type II toxin-antitoxin system PemK/MazF family toxin [Lewinella cohaerens]